MKYSAIENVLKNMLHYTFILWKYVEDNYTEEVLMRLHITALF